MEKVQTHHINIDYSFNLAPQHKSNTQIYDVNQYMMHREKL